MWERQALCVSYTQKKRVKLKRIAEAHIRVVNMEGNPPRPTFSNRALTELAVLRREARLWARPVRVRAKGAHAASTKRGIQPESYGVFEGVGGAGFEQAFIQKVLVRVSRCGWTIQGNSCGR